MRGFLAVLRKETLHMRRDGGTLRIAFIIPVFQLILFGFIDTNVRQIPTVVFDQDRSQASRELTSQLTATSYFKIVRNVSSRSQLREEIVAARASVGIEIPSDYAEKRLDRESATFLVLIDGSESTIASQALAAADGLALRLSLEDLSRESGIIEPPVAPRPRILFNPATRSANLLIPGLVAILLTFSGTLLSAYAIVRERERGTLEQLMVTPVSPVEMVFGKLIPYLGLAFLQLCVVLILMSSVFEVPIRGSVLLLAAFSFVYLTALLSLGLLISARAKTQIEATQMASGILLPSIMLSGYIFPQSSLPAFLRVISQILPATHFITVSRGIIIRGAGFVDLWEQVAAMLLIAMVLLGGSVRVFRKTRL